MTNSSIGTDSGMDDDSPVQWVTGVVSEPHPGSRPDATPRTASQHGKYQVPSDEPFLDERLAAPAVLGGQLN